MRRFFILFVFLTNLSFAQVYAPNPDFCFKPVYKNFHSDLIPDSDYFIRQNDGSYVFTSRFNIINGEKVEDQPIDGNVKLYFKFDKFGNYVPSYRFLSPNRYVFGAEALKDGKMLWFESDIPLTSTRLIRLNSDGGLDSTFKYSGFESYIYRKYVLGNGKIIISVDNLNHKIISEDGRPDTNNSFILPAGMWPISNCFFKDKDYLLAGNTNKTCKIYKINPDFTLKEIYSRNLDNSSWLSNSKIYTDVKGRIYLNLFEGSSYISKIIRLDAEGKEDKSFTTISTITSPELDPQTARLTFTDSGKIVFSRRSVIMSFNEDGTEDSSFKIPQIEKGRTIYDVTEDGKVLMLYKRALKKVDFSGNNVDEFNLKIEISIPIKFNNILSAGNGKYYALNENYAARFDLSGKMDAELFSPDTTLIFKEYFDKQLLISKGNANFVFKENGLQQVSIPDVLSKGTLDYSGRKAYIVEGKEIVRYDESGKEEYRFAHNIPSITQMFVLANRKILILGKLFTDQLFEGIFYLQRFNIDGSVDNDFKAVEISQDGRNNKYFEIIELPNKSVFVKAVVLSEIKSTKMQIIDSTGKEINNLGANRVFGDNYGYKVYDTKPGINNSILFLDRKFTLNRINAQAIFDSVISIKGISIISAFELIDSTSLLLASNDKIFKVNTRKQLYIDLQVPERIDVEGKPVAIRAISSDGSPVELSITGGGILRDSRMTWSEKGFGTITAKLKGNDCYSISMNYRIEEFNPVHLNTVPSLKTTNPPYALSFLFPIDTSQVKFEVIGEAYVLGNTLYLKGKPGTVCVKAIKTNRNNNITLSSTTCFQVEGETITGIEELPDPDKLIKVFPNPSPGGFYLRLEKPYKLKEDSIRLIHISGKNISLEVIKQRDGLYYIKSLNEAVAGIYLVNFLIDGQSISRKLLIE